jgi:hypothetical protein
VQPYTAPGNLPAIALSANGLSLLRFSTANPAAVTEAIIDPAGIVAGDQLMAIDMRPQTGQLYALGFNAVNNTVQLYLVDPWTNVGGTMASVTAVGGPVALTLPGATAFGFDFNPTVDRLRVVSDAGENFRLNPNTGALVLADTAINPAGAVVTAAAYTNNFAQDITAGSPPTLYTLDATNDRLAIQNLPNGGTQTDFHTITLGGTTLDFGSVSGFDIAANVLTTTANAAATGTAYAVLTVGGTTGLYAIELSTGVATAIGNVGAGTVQVSGLALGDLARMPTTTTVSPSPNPSQANAPVTITATVAPADVSGTVAFTANGSTISGCAAQPLTAGVATCQFVFPTFGARSIAASYSGSAAHAPSFSAPVTQTVAGIATSTALIVTPPRAGVGETVTMTATVVPADASGHVAFTANGTTIAFLALPGGPAASGQVTFTTSSLAAGSYEITASCGGSDTYLNSSTAAPLALTVGTFRQHFAEGATGGFFQTDIGVLNASATTAANVTVRLFPEGQPALALRFALEPLGRRSLDLNEILAALGIEGGVSTLVESDQPVAATRQMTWGTPVYGSTLESGVPDTGTTWYFAEGATSPYSLYYMIENPAATEAQVTFTHLLEGGAAPIVWNDVVAPFARRTFYINDVPGAGNAALSTAIESSVPIVAERVMWWGLPFYEGSVALGSTATGTAWAIGEGVEDGTNSEATSHRRTPR